jgi:hypothetical protein
MHKLFLISLLLSSLASLPAWAEPATLLKDTDLYAKPLSDAEAVKSLKAGEKLDITGRKGAWANVKTSSGTAGWLRIFNLRTGSGQQGEAGVGAVASIFHTGSSGNTVSTGIKGMSEEKLKNSSPNPVEAGHLDKLKVTEKEARVFARQGKLGEQQLSYLPDDSSGGGKR